MKGPFASTTSTNIVDTEAVAFQSQISHNYCASECHFLQGCTLACGFHGCCTVTQCNVAMHNLVSVLFIPSPLFSSQKPFILYLCYLQAILTSLKEQVIALSTDKVSVIQTLDAAEAATQKHNNDSEDCQVRYI